MGRFSGFPRSLIPFIIRRRRRRRNLALKTASKREVVAVLGLRRGHRQQQEAALLEGTAGNRIRQFSAARGFPEESIRRRQHCRNVVDEKYEAEQAMKLLHLGEQTLHFRPKTNVFVPLFRFESTFLQTNTFPRKERRTHRTNIVG